MFVSPVDFTEIDDTLNGLPQICPSVIDEPE
jgi:hypothetical protein